MCVCGLLCPEEECVKQRVSSVLSALVHWDNHKQAPHILSVPGGEWCVCVCVCVYECVGVRWAFSELLNGHSVCSKQATERGREKRKIEGNTAVCHFISVRFR